MLNAENLRSLIRAGPDSGYKSNGPGFLIAFPEWIHGKSFNSDLVDGDPACQKIWKQYQIQIEYESTFQEPPLNP